MDNGDCIAAVSQIVSRLVTVATILRRRARPMFQVELVHA